MVKLPGLELLDGFLHGDFSHFDSLLQRYELPLAGRFHAGVGVVHGGGGLLRRLSWRDRMETGVSVVKELQRPC